MTQIDTTYHIPAPPMNDFAGKFVLIGMVGKAGSGKDTVAQYLISRGELLDNEEFWVRRYALADAVKHAASTVFGISLSDFHDREKKEKPTRHLPDVLTPRKLAQLVGTECFREVFGGQVWVNALHRQLKTCGFVGEAVAVTDIRFVEEIEWVMRQGGLLIYLTRDSAEAVSAHASENIMSFEDMIDVGLTVKTNWSAVQLENNGSIQQLYAAIEESVVPALRVMINNK